MSSMRRVSLLPRYKSKTFADKKNPVILFMGEQIYVKSRYVKTTCDWFSFM